MLAFFLSQRLSFVALTLLVMRYRYTRPRTATLKCRATKVSAVVDVLCSHHGHLLACLCSCSTLDPRVPRRAGLFFFSIRLHVFSASAARCRRKTRFSGAGVPLFFFAAASASAAPRGNPPAPFGALYLSWESGSSGIRVILSFGERWPRPVARVTKF